MYSHIEFSLLEFAKEISKSTKTDGNYGHQLEQYLSFLKMNLIEGTISDEMTEGLDEFRLIRNRIIHSNGYVNRESSNVQHIRVVKIAETNPLIDLTEKDRLLISDEYITNCFKLAEELVENTHYAIYGKK